ncbi:MAG: hypothetical protein NC084_06430 [Bacteroides sp.]|nr:hypothetical protein [Eubacterium sp.]MCM1418140.1 hypothetical protein [Roseburia sp.]MCM1462336.1 hypothetical protein [Bacteroides sp.]
MTGEEIVRLIHRLKKEGLDSDKILDIIEDVADPDLKEAAETEAGKDR